MKITLTYLLFILAPLFMAFVPPKNTVIKELTTYAIKNYSIQYPKNWSLNNDGQFGTEFILYSELTTNDDDFRENVNLIIQDLTGKNINLNEFARISNQQMVSLVTNFKSITNEQLTKNKLNFQKVIYSGQQGVFNLITTQYYWVEKEKAYILTLSCKSSDYQEYKKVGEAMLDSFKLK